jgi:hypothetical protein
LPSHYHKKWLRFPYDFTYMFAIPLSPPAPVAMAPAHHVW